MTVVDSSTFPEAYACAAPVSTRPDLGGAAAPVPTMEGFGVGDDEAREAVAAAFGAMTGGGSSQRAVVDLLVEQVECADVIVLNKMDLVDSPTRDSLESLMASLNGRARVLRSVRGAVPVDEVMASMEGTGMAAIGPVDEHKDAVAASRTASTLWRRSPSARSSVLVVRPTRPITYWRTRSGMS